MAKKALGKGLGALIKKQDNPTPIASNSANNVAKANDAPGTRDNEVRLVPIDSVVPSPLQPRKHFTDGQLDDLMDSIRQHGIIQPLITREVNGKLELIAGERRWRASNRLKLTEVPVIIRTASDRDVLEMALIENLQREDLNPIEEAAGYVRLAKEFDMKQDEIATRVGKSRASVANAMRLLDLHSDVQNMVAHGRLTVGHAKAILALKEDKEQLLAADQIIKKKLTVRAAEKLTQDFNKQKTTSKTTNAGGASSEEVALIGKIQTQLQQDFSTRINIHHTPKKGRIEIEYYGNEDLNRILELLGVSLNDF
ncbi:chromosome segregation DNA-binding protein [Rubritalea squalenifaciens DSM 18772]|uniref:Chromosome segregation DNA-binding protein n=1 Tax=Rubritalea squalenifaciens DSM 18772 TaxID=1123071 RepID=A0A1M6M7A6_9BACT|nr:ParB/RepB/Spo0J family partition protein [Rubritalea squalenifaciens]SHJ79347.1 chromosome segregation DNA-binding protein [Rubritalea squalenifaciens DSM 18772]